MGDSSGPKEAEALKLTAAVLAHAGLIVLGARTNVDVPPQALTLQSFFVVYAGFRLGTAHATIATAVYLLLGCCGLPVFADGASGVAVLTGRNGGYVWGYVLAAAIAGRATRDDRWWRLLLFAGLAHAAILMAGAVHLALVSGVTLAGSLAAAVDPFVWGAAGKTLAVSWLAHATARSR